MRVPFVRGPLRIAIAFEQRAMSSLQRRIRGNARYLRHPIVQASESMAMPDVQEDLRRPSYQSYVEHMQNTRRRVRGY